MIVACVVIGCVGMFVSNLVLAGSKDSETEQIDRGVAFGLLLGAFAFWVTALIALWVGTWPR